MEEERLNVVTAPKDSTFQVRINGEIKKTVEEIYARTGITLTDAFNAFIQQSINVEGLPFLVTQNSKDALREQALAMLMMDLKRTEKRSEKEGVAEIDAFESDCMKMINIYSEKEEVIKETKMKKNDSGKNVKLSKIGTADRMMYYVSSGDENSYVNQATLILKEEIKPEEFKKAVGIALNTFKNFKMQIVVQDEILYYKENDAEVPVFPKTDKTYHLGTADTNRYLFRISYDKNELMLSYFHGVTDGIGGTMFLQVILDEYFRIIDAKYAEEQKEHLSEKLKIVDIEDPFAEFAAHKILPLSLPNTKRVFSVQGKGDENESYNAEKYVVSIPRDKVYAFVKENKTTPVAFCMALLASAINKNYEIKKNEHIICMMPANLRPIYQANVCRNFSHVVVIPFKKQYENLAFEQQCANMRADMSALIEKNSMSKMLQQQVLIANFLENNKKPLIERSRRMVRSFMEGADSMCTYEISYMGSVSMPAALKEKVENLSYSHRGCSGFPWVLVYSDDKEMHLEFINYTGNKKLMDSMQEVLREQGFESRVSLSKTEVLDKFVLAEALK